MKHLIESIAEVQLASLARHANHTGASDDPREVANDILEYMASLPRLLQDLIKGQLLLLEVKTGLGPFSKLPLAQRYELLREHVPSGPQTYYFGVSWMVILSRPWARTLLQFKEEGTTTAPVDVQAPPEPVFDTLTEFDVCVIGSGAGGAMIASTLADRWSGSSRRILMIDAGSWVSPAAMSTRHDRALPQLYKNGGAQPALPNLSELIPGTQTSINVLQARVAGGGPTVNNAILLPLSRETYDGWLALGFPDLKQVMRKALLQISRDLRVQFTDPFDASVTNAGEPGSIIRPGWRSEVLGAPGAPGALPPLPVSLWNCIGCGGCNTGCRFGCKTAGIHALRGAGEPVGYFMKAIATPGTIVGFRPRLNADKLDMHKGTALSLYCTDERDPARPNVTIRAKAYVVAAGPVASSLLLRNSIPPDPSRHPIGNRIASNVVTPLYAVFPPGVGNRRPDPGLQMCYFTDPEKGVLLESWFDYPGSLALALSGDTDLVSRLMLKYHELSVFGVVVAVENMGSVRANYPTDIHMKLGPGAIQKIYRGIAHAARLMYSRGAEKVYVCHRISSADLIKKGAGPDWHIPRDLALQGSIEAVAEHVENIISTISRLTLNTAHVQGGNPMAVSRDRGVVSPRFKVFGASNIFVADSSVFPGGARINPQMTAMALARIAADHVAEFVESGAPRTIE